MKDFNDCPELLEAASKGIAVSVVLECDTAEEEHYRHYHHMLGYNIKDSFKPCTILSEIANMPGHYVVVGNKGKMICGLHGDIFKVLEDED